MDSFQGNRGHHLLALIPAYNEASRITPVIKGALNYLPVLVIDDGSSDDTKLVAESGGAEVLALEPNQGKGAALKAGFRYALQGDFAGVITLDADGQHDPVEMTKFITLYREAYPDLIIGTRDFGQMPPVRRLANWLGKQSLSWAMNREILDNQSGYRLISRRLMQDMLDSDQEGFEFEVDMIVICIQKGYDLKWVGIRTIYAGEGSHINPLTHLVNYSRLVLRTRRTIRGTNRRHGERGTSG